jgi:diguanylate cyclase (GGDEF)-like protein/PAS domain S-box-containing protein
VAARQRTLEAMNTPFGPSLAALFAAAAVSLLLGWECLWRRRATPGALALGLLGLAAGEWALTRALEALAPTLAAKLFWAKTEYFGIMSVPAFWFLFAARYSRQWRGSLGRRAAWLGLAPALTLALVWTNEAHGLIWPHIGVAPDGQNLVYDHGLGFWMAVIYNYALLLIGTVWIVRTVRYQPFWYRGPAASLLAGLAVPWVANASYLAGWRPLGNIDPTPVAFVAGGALIAASIFRWQLFDLVPVARNAVVDQMQDGVVILDAQDRLVDLNRAAQQMLGVTAAQSAGRPATLALPGWGPNWTRGETPVEFRAGDLWLEARVTVLPGPADALAGRLVVLRDVTQQKQAATALRLGEARLRQVIDLVPNLIFAKDEAGRYILANQAMAAAYGTTPAGLLGRRDADLARSAAEAHHFRRDDLEVLESGQPVLIPEESLTDAQGQTRLFQTLKIPFTFSGTLAPAILGVATDITSLKTAEAALRESETKLRAILEQFPVAMAVAAPDGRLEFFNRKHAELFGYRPEELPTLEAWWQRAVPDEVYRAEVLRTVQAMTADAQTSGRESRPRELRLAKRDGATRIMECCFVQGAGHGLWTFSDITPLKDAEAALRSSEQRYRWLAENASDVIWTMDFNGRYTYVSPAVEQLRGYTPAEVLGQPLEAAVTPGSLALMMDTLQVAVQELLLGQRQPVVPREVEQPRKGGGTVWTEILARVMYDDASRPTGILGVSRDITARKKLEAENQRLFAAAQRRAMEAQTLREAAAAVTATLDPEEIIPRILEQLRRVVPYDSATVQLQRDANMVVVGGAGFPDLDQVLGAALPLDGSTPNSIVAVERRTVVLRDAPEHYPSFRQPPHDHIHGWLGVPLMAQDRLIGMLALDSAQPGAFDDDHARLAGAFADQVAIALEQARLFQDVQRLAVTDSLTGVHNRRHFFELAAFEYQLACRYQRPLSAILFDLDHFKAVNDAHGHLAGDRVLRAVAQQCRGLLRKSDLVGRYGGEEFVCLLPETTLAGAAQVAERFRTLVAQSDLGLEAAAPLHVTVSLGVAALHPDECGAPEPQPALERLIERADQALYAAKRAGRNCVCLEAEPGAAPPAAG